MGADAGLHGHDAHGVGHDVVELPGYAQPFLGHRPLGLRLLVLLEVDGPELQLKRVGPPRADAVAEHCGDGEDGDVAGQIPGAEILTAEQRKGEHADGGHRRSPLPAGSQAGDGVEGDESDDRQAVLGVVPYDVDAGRSGNHGQDGDGIAAAHGQRAESDEHQEVRPDVGVGRVVGCRPRREAQQAGDRQQPRRHRVDDQRVRALQASPQPSHHVDVTAPGPGRRRPLDVFRRYTRGCTPDLLAPCGELASRGRPRAMLPPISTTSLADGRGSGNTVRGESG